MRKYEISISANNVWAGTGVYKAGVITDCPAVLGGSQDAADKIYETIEGAISATDEPENGEIEIDGVTYSWALAAPKA